MARSAETTTDANPAPKQPRVEMTNRDFPGQTARPLESHVPKWEAKGWVRKG